MTLSLKPEPRLRRGNVYLDRAVFVTASSGRALLSLSNDLDGRDVLTPADLDEVRARLATTLKTLGEVAAEANAADSGLLLDGASWSDRNALSAKRKGASA